MTSSNDISIENRCFGIFHVRLATVIIATWQIIVNIIIISIFMYILQNNPNDISDSVKSGIDDIINLISLGQRKDFIFNLREKYIYYDSRHNNNNLTPNNSLVKIFTGTKIIPLSNKMQDFCFGFSISLITISTCILTIIGCVKVKPPSLMGYFFIEVFFFIMNTLTLISEFSGMPLRNEYDKKIGHTTIISRRLNIFMFILGMVLLSINLYILNVIWACHKFLVRVRKGLNLDQGLSIRTGIFTRNNSTIGQLRIFMLKIFYRTNGASDTESNSLISQSMGAATCVNDLNSQTLEDIEKEDLSLPKYDDVLRIPANANMPPPYFPSNK